MWCLAILSNVNCLMSFHLCEFNMAIVTIYNINMIRIIKTLLNSCNKIPQGCLEFLMEYICVLTKWKWWLDKIQITIDTTYGRALRKVYHNYMCNHVVIVCILVDEMSAQECRNWLSLINVVVVGYWTPNYFFKTLCSTIFK